MNLFILFILAVLLVAFGMIAWHVASKALTGLDRQHTLPLENVSGTHQGGKITRKADAVVASRYLLAKVGSDEDHLAICGASDDPVAVYTDEAAAIEDSVACTALGGSVEGTLTMIASEAVTAGERLYTAAGGKVQDLPAGAGTYYCVGRAARDAGADEEVEVIPFTPVAVVVAG